MTALLGGGRGGDGTCNTSVSALFNVARPLLFNMGLRCNGMFLFNVMNNTMNNLIACMLGVDTANVNVAFVPNVLLCSRSLATMLNCLVIVTDTFMATFVLAQVCGPVGQTGWFGS